MIPRIDWLSGTFSADVKHSEIADYFNDLLGHGYDAGQQVIARQGYTRATAYNGVCVMYNPDRDDMGKHFVLSGTMWDDIYARGGDVELIALGMAVAGRMKVSRLDVQVTVFRSKWDLHHFASLAVEQRRSNPKLGTVGIISKSGCTLELGSRLSDHYVRVYEKWIQDARYGKNTYRVELEMKGAVARAVIGKLSPRTPYADTLAAHFNGVFIKKIEDYPHLEAAMRDVMDTRPCIVPVGRKRSDFVKWVEETLFTSFENKIVTGQMDAIVAIRSLCAHVIKMIDERYPQVSDEDATV